MVLDIFVLAFKGFTILYQHLICILSLEFVQDFLLILKSNHISGNSSNSYN